MAVNSSNYHNRNNMQRQAPNNSQMQQQRRPAQQRPNGQRPSSARPQQRNVSRAQYNNQYNGRRPNRQRKKKNNGFSAFVVLLVAILAICLIVVLVKSVNVGDGGNMDTNNPNASLQSTLKPNESETAKQTETTAPETTAKPEEPEYIPEFKTDLSAYEMYMNPKDEQRDAYLLLVNPWNALSENDVPTDLVDVKSTRKDGRATQQLREYAAKALEALMIEAEACGMVTTNTPSGKPLSVMSAYRTYSYQNELFNRYVGQEMNSRGISREEAEKIVVTYSCRAGTSEHQTALCVDMHTLPSAGQAFKNEKEAKWLAENSYKFGFILRFPEDKTSVTGITYEPWHFRYVGRYHAKKMFDLNMCLEEYTEYLKKN